MSFRDMG